MPPLAWAAAIAILIATGVALRSSAARRVLVATSVIAIAAPLASAMPGGAAVVGFRVVVAIAALLAARALLSGSDQASRGEPMPLGGLADVAFVVVAFALGLGTAGWAAAPPGGGDGTPSATPADPLALATAAALAVAAVDLILFGRDPLRAAAGAVFVVLGGELAVRALFDTRADLSQVGAALAAAAGVVAGAVLARSHDGVTSSAEAQTP